MFVVSVPCGIFNKTSQATTYLKKKKERKEDKTHTYKRLFTWTKSSVKFLHMEAERIMTIK